MFASMGVRRALIALSTLWLGAASAWAQSACSLEEITLQGSFADLKSRAELSGAAMHGDYLLVLSNEAIGPNEDYHAVQVFERDGDQGFRWIRDEVIYKPEADICAQADFEALAVSGNRLYVVGSHSVNHRKQSTKNTYEKNRKTLLQFETEACKSRHNLFEFEIDGQARVTLPPHRIKTEAALSKHAVLRAFSQLPSKENGIDIEGLAVKDDSLYLGFRGPALRENFVPILRIDISAADQPEIMFVNLSGRGARDMAATSDGFLILGGPTVGGYRDRVALCDNVGHHCRLRQQYSAHGTARQDTASVRALVSVRMYGGGDASDLRDRPSNTVFGRVDRRTTRTFRVAVVAGRRSSTLTPPALRQMFDASGAKYRVVIISACYSGVFVPVLANPRTLVITAAAADRSSFGCEDGATWTYFAWPV